MEEVGGSERGGGRERGLEKEEKRTSEMSSNNPLSFSVLLSWFMNRVRPEKKRRGKKRKKKKVPSLGGEKEEEALQSVSCSSDLFSYFSASLSLKSGSSGQNTGRKGERKEEKKKKKKTHLWGGGKKKEREGKNRELQRRSGLIPTPSFLQSITLKTYPERQVCIGNGEGRGEKKGIAPV